MTGVFGNKAWFSRKGTRSVLRAAVKDDVLSHNQFVGINASNRKRTLESLLFKGVDLKKYVSKMLASRKGRLKILDAGGGYLFLARELKDVFRGKVHLTALSLSSSSSADKHEVVTKRELGKVVSSRGSKSKEELFLRDKLRNIKQFKQNVRQVNSYRVSLFENYAPKEKYGLILDIYGPSVHSNYPQRVVEQYANLLETGGKVVTTGNFEEIVAQQFGKNSEYARQTGKYLVFSLVPHSGFINQIVKRSL